MPLKEQANFFQEEKKPLMIYDEIQGSSKSPLIDEIQAGIQSSSKKVPENLLRNAKKNASSNLAFLELHTDLLSKEERKRLFLFKLDSLEDQAQIQELVKKIKNQLSSEKEKSQEQYLQEQAHSEIGAIHKK